MNLCPACQSPNQPGALFCEMCGSRLAAAPAPAAPASPQAAPSAGGLKCPTCGHTALPGEAFCEECGTPLAVSTPAPAATPAQGAYPPPTPVVPPAAMVQSACPSCGASVLPGEAFCDSCGASLSPAAPQAAPQPQPAPQPQSVPQAPPQPQPAPVTPPRPTPTPQPIPQPAPAVPPAATLNGWSLRTATGQLIALPAQVSAVIGREDAASNHYPDVDLSPHGALSDGVGRQHARIFMQNGLLMIEDLSSTNGTAVNRQRLTPHQPQALQSGDEVRLGKHLLTIVR